jgi:[acyl-carrier-protein] S-malonyltransferase
LDEAGVSRLIAARATAMAKAAQEKPGMMAAVLDMENAELEALCAECAGGEVLLPVNYNCRGQTVVAGQNGAMKRLLAALKKKKIRAMKLRVSGAFHTPLMHGAAQKVALMLDETGIKQPQIPIYLNASGELCEDAAQLHELVGKQTMSPVYFETIVRNMAAAGCEIFIELGPGKTLSGLVKKTLVDAQVYNVEIFDDIQKLKESIG